VRTTLNGVSKSWYMFVQAVVGRERLPTWDRLWDAFVQEETRRGYIQGSTSGRREEEENVALAEKRKKGKFIKGPTGGDESQGQGKKKGKNMGKVKCWNCQKMGHYAVTCPKKKKKGKTKDVAASVYVDRFSQRFEEDFAFMAGRPTGESCSVTWYIDSGASCHMKGVREQFLELSQRTVGHDTVLGDDRAFSLASIGTVMFQRESSPSLRLTDVFYVPGLKRILFQSHALRKRHSKSSLMMIGCFCIRRAVAHQIPE